jgi:membrane protein implicated in regulation of membrane protease activity
MTAESMWLKLAALFFLIAFVTLLWLFWRFARSFPVTAPEEPPDGETS